jgi:capsular polysaccharide biosynthesis protein
MNEMDHVDAPRIRQLSEYIRIRQVFRLARKKILVIAVVSLVVTVALSAYFNFLVPEKASVSATLHILPKIDEPWLDVATINLRYSAYNDALRNITQIAKSDYVVRTAVERANFDISFVREWDSSISVAFLPNTGLLKISAATESVGRSTEIATAFLDVLTSEIEKSYDNVRIVVAAPVEPDIVEPKMLSFGLIPMVLTLICSAAAVLMLLVIQYFFGNRMIHEGDILRYTSRPLLYQTPKGEETTAARMIYGILRAYSNGNDFRTISVSGFRSDSQTVEIVSQLGETFLMNQRKVLLIDADCTQAALSSHRNLKDRQGVLEFLRNDIQPEEIQNFIVKEDHRADILPAGKNGLKQDYPANIAKIQDLLRQFVTGYDCVIIYTGSLEKNEESAMISSYTDASLIFFQQGKVHAERFEKICSEFRHLQSPLAGFVMTDAFL